MSREGHGGAVQFQEPYLVCHADDPTGDLWFGRGQLPLQPLQHHPQFGVLEDHPLGVFPFVVGDLLLAAPYDH